MEQGLEGLALLLAGERVGLVVFSGTAFEPRIVNRELHFSIWNEPERGLPAVLNMGDLEKMSASDCCFARKVDVDSELGRALLERWNG